MRKTGGRSTCSAELSSARSAPPSRANLARVRSRAVFSSLARVSCLCEMDAASCRLSSCPIRARAQFGHVHVRRGDGRALLLINVCSLLIPTGYCLFYCGGADTTDCRNPHRAVVVSLP